MEDHKRRRESLRSAIVQHLTYRRTDIRNWNKISERVMMLKFTDTVLFVENEMELKNGVE